MDIIIFILYDGNRQRIQKSSKSTYHTESHIHGVVSRIQRSKIMFINKKKKNRDFTFSFFTN